MRVTNEPGSNQSDEELMIAYQNGDSEAFNTLYDRIAGKLYSYLERRVRSSELVDDIFQATMTKFHLTRHQYRAPLAVMPWAFTICRTVMIDMLRSGARRREILTDASALELPVNSPLEQITPTQDDKAPIELLDLRNLSQSQKEAVSLRFEHDLSFEEIALRLQTSPANARQLVSRAVKKIKSLVAARGKK